MGLNPSILQGIDAIAQDAISNHATPSAVVLVAKQGSIVYHKSYGYYDYTKLQPVSIYSIYDMASVTKICATTLAIMQLYDQGRLKLTDTVAKYIPWLRNTNKAKLTIHNILLHQAGLVSYIPFYKETIDSTGTPKAALYSKVITPLYTIPVADSMYMLTSYQDTMYSRIATSKVEANPKYVYSDNDFIFLGLVVEKISGLALNQYVTQKLYTPLGLTATGYLPLQRFAASTIVPTETELIYRQQTLRGTVHDPGAAMLGGVAGHAGLFSTASDLAIIMQMVLNGGSYNGVTFFKQSTVDLFTTYQSSISRRGYGFDKPEKDNDTRKEPYPSAFVSPLAFGHTGYTGTCVWADPQQQLIYIFLSNRVHPSGGDNTKLIKMNIRGRIQDVIYKAIK